MHKLAEPKYKIYSQQYKLDDVTIRWISANIALGYPDSKFTIRFSPIS